MSRRIQGGSARFSSRHPRRWCERICEVKAAIARTSGNGEFRRGAGRSPGEEALDDRFEDPDMVVAGTRGIPVPRRKYVIGAVRRRPQLWSLPPWQPPRQELMEDRRAMPDVRRAADPPQDHQATEADPSLQLPVVSTRETARLEGGNLPDAMTRRIVGSAPAGCDGVALPASAPVGHRLYCRRRPGRSCPAPISPPRP